MVGRAALRFASGLRCFCDKKDDSPLIDRRLFDLVFDNHGQTLLPHFRAYDAIGYPDRGCAALQSLP